MNEIYVVKRQGEARILWLGASAWVSDYARGLCFPCPDTAMDHLLTHGLEGQPSDEVLVLGEIDLWSIEELRERRNGLGERELLGR